MSYGRNYHRREKIEEVKEAYRKGFFHQENRTYY